VKYLAPEDWEVLRRLRLAGGNLVPSVIEAREDGRPAETIIARDPDGLILGWALIHDGIGSRPEIMVYVRRSHRRQGIGTALMREAMRGEERPIVTPWDLGSRCFFDSLGLGARSASST